MDFCARRRPCAPVPTQTFLSMKFWRLAALLAMLALSTLAAGQATQLTIVAPFNVGVGAAFSMTVKAVDANQNIDTSYTGTISLSSTDTNASFSPQPPYTFTLADAGIHSFQVHLNTTNTQTIFVNDGNLNGNTAINVSSSALNTTTTIASSSNPSVYGQLVNFTITAQTSTTGDSSSRPASAPVTSIARFTSIR